MWLPLLLLACGAPDPERGAELYSNVCESCHGADGGAGVQVDGVAASDLGEAVPGQGDEALLAAMLDGSGAMPPQPLSRGEAEDVLAWLRERFP